MTASAERPETAETAETGAGIAGVSAGYGKTCRFGGILRGADPVIAGPPAVVYIYRLDIIYPQGSQRPGWRPERWSDPEFRAQLSRKARKRIDRTEFRWPRERRFLSSSGAYARAWLLRFYGAIVDVRRSLPVQWPEFIPAGAMVSGSGTAYGGPWPEFDASGIPLDWLLDPVSAS